MAFPEWMSAFSGPEIAGKSGQFIDMEIANTEYKNRVLVNATNAFVG